MTCLKKLIALERPSFFFSISVVWLAINVSCEQPSDGNTAFAKAESSSTVIPEKYPARSISQEWKDYWYEGTAEISSYSLQQVRYGEMRSGTSALIFVTEEFLPTEQVKADRQSESNIPVLKLNATKKFTTGIYPYSVMTSTFYPVTEERHALKISQSMQEWCGHVYTQLNNRTNFDIKSHSYFESEGDQQLSVPKEVLENELWTQLRLNPRALPTGTFQAIPNLEYVRMKHIELKAYTAIGTLREDRYTLEYPALGRQLTIIFESQFPFIINGWEETYPEGRNGKPMTTRATKIKTLKSAYWGKNRNVDGVLRQELGLDS